ncbi:MAG: TylF/MycF/NovP-related O-methyltransferase [Cyclobacteriaceae bacterium]
MKSVFNKLIHKLTPKTTNQFDFLLRDQRVDMFRNAMTYINYEMVEGDILEFGVWAGKTLAILGYLDQFQFPKYDGRKLYGFDSFKGLQNMTEYHPRWHDGICNINYEGRHPVCKKGQKVDADVVMNLFAYYKLNPPIIKEGFFVETLKSTIHSEVQKVALVHLDCDLYESTIQVLEGIEPVLSTGAILLFDDYYHYKANPNMGQARALREFVEKFSDRWELVKFKPYHNVCQSFFIIKK